MYRLMQPSDQAAVLALWQSQRGDTEEFARNAVERFAGEQNVYVAEENDEIVAVALAVPVTLQGRTGSYLYGLCGQGSLILAGLLDYLCAQQKLRGAGFTVAVPTGAEQAALLQDKGFARAFALRCLSREVDRNLWSQADFDSVTAKKLCELRQRFWSDTVQLSPDRMAVVLGDLYSRGCHHRFQRAGLRHLFPQGGHPLFRGDDGRGRPQRRKAYGSRPGKRGHRGKGCHHRGSRPDPVSGGGHPAGLRHDPL